MDSLPDEVCLEVLQYLSQQDIAACGMVCRSWRERLNSDYIWRTYCSPRTQLEEYLRTTPCAVEPHFALLDPPDSSLSSPCQWKVANLREKHLWNNIREGRFKDTLINYDEGMQFPRAYGFLSDDLVFLAFSEHIEAWDIQVNPALKVSESDESFTDGELKSFTVVGEEKNVVMVVDRFKVRLFQLDVQKGFMTETNEFFFHGDETISYRRSYANDGPRYVVHGSKFVGAIVGCSNKLHVWDLERGSKICEDELDMSGFYIDDIYGSNTTSDVLVVASPKISDETSDAYLQSSSHTRSRLIYLVYSLRRTSFYKFQAESPSTKKYNCAILDGYVAIWDEQPLRMYNYKTSKLVFNGLIHRFEAEYVLCSVLSVGDFFIISDMDVNAYNPKSKANYNCDFDVSAMLYGGFFKKLEPLHQLGKFCIQGRDAFCPSTSASFYMSSKGLKKLCIKNCHAMNSSGTRYLYCQNEMSDTELMMASMSLAENLSFAEKLPQPHTSQANICRRRKLVTVRQFW